ncbi:hypothetical protein R1sor_006594 [Riccia sorocarpa]|uniref:Uncharacterized protein n=1 Tax=Riccia sorocarpa TaxID=122646 RepID=A0ABD3HMX1_9MARC
MADRVLLTFKGTNDTDLLPCTDGVAIVDVHYCRARWNLVPESVYISDRVPHGDEFLNVFLQKSAGTWTLPAGKRYTIFGLIDNSPGQLPRRSQSIPASVVTGPCTIDEAASTTAATTYWSEIPPDPSLVSSYTALRDIRGKSELSRLLLSDFTHSIVVRLPDKYNENMIFELPPVKIEDALKKGAILEGMDRAHDCWLWTKCTTTSASIGIRPAEYTVNRIQCVGSLECRSSTCRKLSIDVRCRDRFTPSSPVREYANQPARVVVEEIPNLPVRENTNHRMGVNEKRFQIFEDGDDTNRPSGFAVNNSSHQSARVAVNPSSARVDVEPTRRSSLRVPTFQWETNVFDEMDFDDQFQPARVAKPLAEDTNNAPGVDISNRRSTVQTEIDGRTLYQHTDGDFKFLQRDLPQPARVAEPLAEDTNNAPGVDISNRRSTVQTEIDGPTLYQHPDRDFQFQQRDFPQPARVAVPLAEDTNNAPGMGIRHRRSTVHTDGDFQFHQQAEVADPLAEDTNNAPGIGMRPQRSTAVESGHTGPTFYHHRAGESQHHQNNLPQPERVADPLGEDTNNTPRNGIRRSTVLEADIQTISSDSDVEIIDSTP